MADSPTRVLLVDFGGIAREGFRDTLVERGFDVVALDCRVDEIRGEVERRRPDVVVFDMDGEDTAAVAEEVNSAFPGMKVIACSAEQPRMRVYPREGGEPYLASLDPGSLAEEVQA
jgi:DNA-binding NarL/FixJ family response regulator